MKFFSSKGKKKTEYPQKKNVISSPTITSFLTRRFRLFFAIKKVFSIIRPRLCNRVNFTIKYYFLFLHFLVPLLLALTLSLWFTQALFFANAFPFKWRFEYSNFYLDVVIMYCSKLKWELEKKNKTKILDSCMYMKSYVINANIIRSKSPLSSLFITLKQFQQR